MELVTTDDVVYACTDEFIQKSKLLADWPVVGRVKVPMTHDLLLAIESETYPPDKETLLVFARAADFLQIDHLVDESARRIAQFLNGMPAEKIWSFLGTDVDGPNLNTAGS